MNDLNCLRMFFFTRRWLICFTAVLTMMFLSHLIILELGNIVTKSNYLLKTRYSLDKSTSYDIDDNYNDNDDSQQYTLTMKLFHKKVYQKVSHSQMKCRIQQEIDSENVFKLPLDLFEDRNILMKLFPDPSENRSRLSDQLNLKLRLQKNNYKLIFIFPNEKNEQENKFSDLNCNVKQCNFTSNFAQFKDADLVFSSYNPKNNLYVQNIVESDQVLVWKLLESPENIEIKYMGSRVNWTSTYRRDSVLHTPYAYFKPYPHFYNFSKNSQKNFARGKSKKVAWFVSNCGASNGRLEYAQQLNIYIDVDIYGNCGSYYCSRDEEKCFKMLKQDYKFYLAFENSNCRDYVTEKLFINAFSNDVLPIVMGAHSDEYKQIAPPNSYIHVRDFENPKHLAEYLHFLDKNDVYYNQYFLWKDFGELIDTKLTCRICAMAHLAAAFPMWYSNLRNWWNKDGSCYSSQLNARNKKSLVGSIRYGYNRSRID